ncbi:hypothetical protein INT43_007118, partial [Umbelopsis isabellina]
SFEFTCPLRFCALSLNLMFPRAELLYTRCYCEENIYQLCRWVKATKENVLGDLTVVFISNPLRRIPIWEQSSSVEGNFLIWDYHVILVHFKDEVDESLVYDFDTRLAFPTPIKKYVWLSFRPDLLLNEQFERYFRLIPAKDFLSHFASDRSHMVC